MLSLYEFFRREFFRRDAKIVHFYLLFLALGALAVRFGPLLLKHFAQWFLVSIPAIFALLPTWLKTLAFCIAFNWLIWPDIRRSIQKFLIETIREARK